MLVADAFGRNSDTSYIVFERICVKSKQCQSSLPLPPPPPFLIIRSTQWFIRWKVYSGWQFSLLAVFQNRIDLSIFQFYFFCKI